MKKQNVQQNTEWRWLNWRSFQFKHAFIQMADINSSVSLLLPPHRPTSPAAPDGLVWWLPSRETWPAPSAPAYWSTSLPLVQSDRSPAAPGKQQRSRGGSRWRWCAGFSSCRAPLDFLGLRGKARLNGVKHLSARPRSISTWSETYPRPCRSGWFLAPRRRSDCDVLSRPNRSRSLAPQVLCRHGSERQNEGSPLSLVCKTDGIINEQAERTQLKYL